MKKVVTTILLSCIALISYSQSKNILEYIEYMEKRLQVDRSTVAKDFYERRQSEVFEKRRWATKTDQLALNELIQIIQDSIDSHSDYLMSLQNIEDSIAPIVQNKVLDLMPKNMIELLGKVNRTQFEEFAGEAVGEEDNFIVYEVESPYEKIPIAIRCSYHEKTGKLINVHFPTPSHLGYELGFIHLPESKKFGSHKVYKNQFNKTYRIDYRYKSLGMQVLYDGVISYHIVK